MHKVSVIIPTYKRSERLGKAIDSVLNQTYEDIEVIVVDDNDPDTEYRKTTEKFMLKYKDNSKVIYIKHEKNKNGAAARNTGIRESKGKYIAFLDDDDYFLPEKIEKQVMFLEKNKEYDGVYCGRNQKGKDVVPFLSGDLSEYLLSLKFTPTTSSLLFRKEPIIQIKGFDETFTRHQDFEFLLRFFEKYKLGYVKDVLLVIGDNEGENIPKGKKLDDIKKKFFDTFKQRIESLEKHNKGIKKEIYGSHYANAFLTHLRTGYYLRALKIYFRFLFYSPIIFHKLILKKISAYKKYKKYKARKNDD